MRQSSLFRCACLLLFTALSAINANSQEQTTLTPKFPFDKSGPVLARHTELGSFYDVTGHRAAVFGYENKSAEAWVYPLKILDDFNLSFQLEGYPLEIPASDIAAHIEVRPEATIFTYSHAAFTARQIIFAPVDEQGIIMLLDVQSVLPVKVTWSFRPRLRLMWPAGSMTSNLGWVENDHVYHITEETNRYVGIVGSPSARDISVMPYQEEPRDVPVRFVVEASNAQLKSHFIPIIITGSVEGLAPAKANYQRLLAGIPALYQKNVEYYKRFLANTVSIETPETKLNEAFTWAKLGVEKGIATNPFLGTGLLAGYRTSGESERPGFAWFFGRDALWTAFALNSYGDFAATRTTLDFLKKFQRADGKIPHEISQSASLIDWFDKYNYPWASADATPLYVIAHADYWRASGDTNFIRANWPSILKAYRFTAATDTDGNNLIENTKFGHGWVEGGALYPAHEEIYMQGLWIEASRGLAQLAEIMNEPAIAQSAKETAERTREAMERTYWLPDRNFYAFATVLPRTAPPVAEPGPYRLSRQKRLEELSAARLLDEDTILPAVPLWWRTMEDERAQLELDHLGSADIATDWGARIISNRSQLYDPLSYHYGSVWPLFTGWAAMAGYKYGRPHIGHQALMSSALLTYQGALGYITELLSGDYNAAFGRSSHHQIWSEAMVVTPTLRGLIGLEADAGGRQINFAPTVPINWDEFTVRNFAAGASHYDVAYKKNDGRLRITLKHGDAATQTLHVNIAPAFPLDAVIRSVTINNRQGKFVLSRAGDVQRANVEYDGAASNIEVVFSFDEGSDVYSDVEEARPGATNQGLRVIRSRASDKELRLTLEGAGGRDYILFVRTPHKLGETPDAKTLPPEGRDAKLQVKFSGPENVYTRRDINIPLLPHQTRPKRRT